MSANNDPAEALAAFDKMVKDTEFAKPVQRTAAFLDWAQKYRFALVKSLQDSVKAQTQVAA